MRITTEETVLLTDKNEALLIDQRLLNPAKGVGWADIMPPKLFAIARQAG